MDRQNRDTSRFRMRKERSQVNGSSKSPLLKILRDIFIDIATSKKTEHKENTLVRKSSPLYSTLVIDRKKILNSNATTSTDFTKAHVSTMTYRCSE